ncbi:hypothetical protein BDZ91DRAFT_721861 [Kalaharituber pfeilii]|nr:hypothetical protein BDZ91DRAFT_721861 [Kalaharituber pfeilii]
MISSARTSYSTPNTTYLILDAASITSPTTQSHLKTHLPTSNSKFTKIFSNAALHWILRPLAPSRGSCDLSPLVTFFSSCYDLLAPGGVLVTESGAHGNVAEVHTALVSALIHRGVPPSEARSTSPWFFPSTTLMSTVLTRAGFIVETCEAEFRPTELPGGDVQGWVRLFGQAFLDKIEGFVKEREGGDEEKGRQAREDVVRDVAEAMEGVGRRVEDETFVLGYVRLRIRARKPEGGV